MCSARAYACGVCSARAHAVHERMQGERGGLSLEEVAKGADYDLAEAAEEIADQGGSGIAPRQHLGRARAGVRGCG